MPGVPDTPTYSDKDMTVYAKHLVELSREVLPDDMRVLVVVVDGSELKNKRLRTRMVTNMGTKLTEKVFETAGKNLGQVIPAKKHYAMKLQPGKYGLT